MVTDIQASWAVGELLDQLDTDSEQARDLDKALTQHGWAGDFARNHQTVRLLDRAALADSAKRLHHWARQPDAPADVRHAMRTLANYLKQHPDRCATCR